MKYTLIQVINEEVKILKENATIEDFNKEKVELEKTYKKEIIDSIINDLYSINTSITSNIIPRLKSKISD